MASASSYPSLPQAWGIFGLYIAIKQFAINKLSWLYNNTLLLFLALHQVLSKQKKIVWKNSG